MMKDNMKHVCACMLSVVVVCVSTTAHAAVDWDESWEYADNAAWLGSGNWGASSCTPAGHTGIMEISSERAFSGSKSLKLTYIGHDPVKTCFIDRFFGGTTDTVYTRIYMFLDNFVASNVNTKMFTSSKQHSYPNFWWSLLGPSNTHRVAIEGTTLGTGSNIHGGNLPSGRWVCVETHVTLNTPGVANGIIQSWIDGTQQINRTNLLLRNETEVVINGTPPNANTNGPNSSMQYTRFYRQHGLGVVYFDRYAVSQTTRIGCLGTSSTDTRPPASPSNFMVN